MLWRFGRSLLMAAYTFLVVSLLVFSLFECFPRLLDVVNLQPIAYYALKRDLLADPALVFVLRKVNDVVRTTWKGDQYSSAYGVDVVPMPYVATTNAEGFRPNSAGPPYEIVLVGDSFLAMGEDDASTLSERLRAVSGRATFNLSRSWYGPYQYLELLKRYGLALRPKVVLLGFYAGNDIEDIREYHRWRREQRYYFYADHAQRPFFVRYTIALTDTGAFLRETLAKRLARQPRPGTPGAPGRSIPISASSGSARRWCRWCSATGTPRALPRSSWPLPNGRPCTHCSPNFTTSAGRRASCRSCCTFRRRARSMPSM